jgi:diguanylate cyclase (GGDEF)-like protein/PAS domain S-box-containing protein
VNVRRKTLLIVTASILFTAVPGTLLIYDFAKRQVIEQQSAQIVIETKRLVEPVTRRFVQAGVKLPELARLLQTELSKPYSRRELDEFYRAMVRDEHGVWRNRKPPYDGTREAGIFLPPNAHGSDVQKLRHWRIKKVLDTFGAAAARKLENTWYLSPERSEIIYDRNLPDFTIGMVPDNDYTQTPWVTHTSPALNPQREMRYTPPLYDPVAEAWMVSAIYPLYLGDEWLGTIGEDMQLTNVMGALFTSSQLYADTQHFLIDDAGHFVLAGDQQKQLEANQEKFAPDFSSSPDLQKVLASELSDVPQILGKTIKLKGRTHIAIGMKLAPLGWHYFELVPEDQIMATTKGFFVSLISMILLVSLVSGIAIEVGVSGGIVRRLQLLSGAISRFGKGEHVELPELARDNDEIAQAAAAFNEMADNITRSIHEREAAEQALRASEERWKFALEGAGDGVWDWSVQTGEALFSKRWKEMAGYSEEEFPNHAEAWIEHLHPDDKERVLATVEEYFASKLPTYAVEFRMRCKDGSYKWIMARGKVISRDEQGKPLRMLGTHTDISVIKQNEDALKLAAMVYQVSSEAMLIADAGNRIISVNAAFTATTGYTAEEVIGQNPRILSSGRQDASFYRAMWDSINTTGRWQGEIWNRRKGGELYAEHLTINTIFDADGMAYRRVALSSDITDRKRSEELIWRQANFDTLTGLPNRRMFRDRLSVEMKKTHRDQKSLAVLFIDLDRFKEVNDSLGHHVGDELLIQAANRLRECVRETDTVARLGGDEFTVILSELKELADIERLTQNIISKLGEPYHLGIEVAHVSASIGITVYPSDATDLEQLLQNADQAMYVAKDQGRNRFSYFTPELQESALQRLRLIGELNTALKQEQFSLYFQPIVELATGQIRKAEALIRWLHPTQGLVSPMTFIPLAEETELIIPIGDWVFRESARRSKQWGPLVPGGVFQISVNKSPVQFMRKETEGEKWVDYLKELGLHGNSISVEITEGLLLNRDDATSAKLLEFRDAGLQVSLDDFGTGYSSLSYLKKFDIDYLKIDQSFVRNIVDDPADLVLCEAIVVMAHKLGLKVIAEGVETTEQRDILLRIGCDFGQGFLFAKPMPGDEFESLVKRQPVIEC